jgi:hypothetical protein
MQFSRTLLALVFAFALLSAPVLGRHGDGNDNDGDGDRDNDGDTRVRPFSGRRCGNVALTRFAL